MPENKQKFMTSRTPSNCHEVFMVPLSIYTNQAVMIFAIIIKLRPTTLRQIQIPEFPSN